MTDRLERTLSLARATLAPSNADDERTRSALGLRPQALAASPAVAPSRAGVWSALRASGRGGAAIGALLIGLGFAAGYWIGRGSEPGDASPPATSPVARDVAFDPQPKLAAAPDVLARLDSDVAAPPEGPAPAREAVPGAPESPRPSAPRARHERAASPAPERAHRPPAARAAGVPDPSEELALLRRIEKSLRADEPALALALLGELEERFPSTRLDEERAAAAVLVHCALRDPGSRRRAEEFLSERAGSVYADRVRSSCSLATTSPPRELPAASGQR